MSHLRESLNDLLGSNFMRFLTLIKREGGDINPMQLKLKSQAN